MAMYVVGHKIPDSDSICGAIALAYLKNQIGEAAIATRLGDVSPETQFILDTFGFEAPELKMSYAGEEVYIVDHTEKTQAPDDIDEATVVGVVDHHKLGDLTTSTPLECWIRPVGCSNTIIKMMYDFYGVEIPKNIAGLMLGAILSDTVIFKSPTCTTADIKCVEVLAEIAGIEDYKAFGMEMFKVKSAVEGTPARDLVMRDFKDFNMNGNLVGIGQLEVIDLAVFDDIKADLEADIAKLKEEGGRHSVFLLLTDIMKEGSQMLIASDDEGIVERAYGVAPEQSRVWLDGVLSRKKQVVPPLQDAFA
ncbi:MAG: manganese-dependent inorganic pyrophosphatase [Pseudomonadota bacterium]|jgi:manganese-dependent inorganic pyrophosphatase|uniref:inorganic diphosphatase n=3 Tax=Pseudoalteromonas TaxID=53246 RepID=A0A5S3YS63_9GAMM|nr:MULTISPECIES: manganese-dependent inorganic pyrophosphatase [Pseudoalteromonas]MEC8326490.1 manganese-dependent inorganic pyrophosphatase [Pseudomonadota bacterium]ATC99606.1 manganese-dependent inorganic pyrophosphatase [Pseudoalteromonas spongiae UST010723-006]KPV94829.1 Manganese-dependent inorganic pyrophosphatase [Pseudoalteromonas sp. P1-9]MDE3273576.1 manganese-dependent inorganic pyrophosphatase [Pseudoalteromonas sp. G4]TLX48704.1 manganese-dependent inorganic pyrophosphatase [Pseu|tara:strand:- start:2884 stop:3804 length:921 start_codon:yes stop_codon:yes gene_type:complete